MRILDGSATIERAGKNWYVTVGGCRITVNITKNLKQYHPIFQKQAFNPCAPVAAKPLSYGGIQMNDLVENIDRLHTTELGAGHIKRNLRLETDDVVQWCRMRILDGVLQDLARLKDGHYGRGDLDHIVGLGVAAGAGGPLAKWERVFWQFSNRA